MTTPTLRISIECQMMNPPKPVGCGVFDGDKMVGVITLENLRACMGRLEELEATHSLARRASDQP